MQDGSDQDEKQQGSCFNLRPGRRRKVDSSQGGINVLVSAPCIKTLIYVS